MKINTNQVLKNYKGEPLRQQEATVKTLLKLLQSKGVKEDEINDALRSSKADMKLGDVLVDALNFENANPQAGEVVKHTGEEKGRVYKLSIDIAGNDQIDIESQDSVAIKKGLVVIYNPMVYGQVVNILEQKETSTKEDPKNKEK